MFLMQCDIWGTYGSGVKVTVFLGVKLCNLVEIYQHIRGTGITVSRVEETKWLQDLQMCLWSVPAQNSRSLATVLL